MNLLFLLIVSVLLIVACNGSDVDENGDGEVTNNNDGDTAEGAEEQGIEEITFILDWVPNTNHTGLYVAQENGYFYEEGIDLTIIEPALDGALQIIASGQADFGIAAQNEVTLSRSNDIPVVSLAAVMQESTSGFASPIEKDITSPKDFEGKKYGGWGSPLEDAIIGAVMEANDADPSTVENITVGTSDFFVNTQREVDFQWIYYGWTGVEAEVRGEELNMIYLHEIDPVFNYYTPVIASSETFIEENPEVTERFMRALSKGYEFAIENPEEAAEILIGVTPETDADLIRASQKHLQSIYQGDAEKWGYQEESRWDEFTAWMLENELIENDVDTESSMTNRFLP
ncbi:ABC transporter substrate-binding protein [Bacillus alkalicola]|uniref:ABC transporter substrate-binding protein n=2 Tax=Bacillales TaxID=1385 RepID=A0ABS6JW30_9BACI|nr:ABC transporter substrate-binding protein [Bacillus alkalicola]